MENEMDLKSFIKSLISNNYIILHRDILDNMVNNINATALKSMELICHYPNKPGNSKEFTKCEDCFLCYCNVILKPYKTTAEDQRPLIRECILERLAEFNQEKRIAK